LSNTIVVARKLFNYPRDDGIEITVTIATYLRKSYKSCKVFKTKSSNKFRNHKLKIKSVFFFNFLTIWNQQLHDVGVWRTVFLKGISSKKKCQYAVI